MQGVGMGDYSDGWRTGFQRIRLSEWARREGIARLTAYRMLRRGILPVSAEQSPTGRWYVFVPQQGQVGGRVAFYARASPGLGASAVLNRQIEALAEWASAQRRSAFVVVREVANPFTDRLSKLILLLADSRIRDIVIENVNVVGEAHYQPLVAALAAQGRGIILTDTRMGGVARARYAREGIHGMCRLLHGPDHAAEAARRAVEYKAGV